MATTSNIIQVNITNAPDIGDIIVSDDLVGFSWILAIIDRNKYYANRILRDALQSNQNKLASTPIISVNSSDYIVDIVNTDIDDTLDFEVSQISLLSDNEIIQCVIKSVGLTDVIPERPFVITPREIQTESPFIDQPPTLSDTEFDIINFTTEPKPSSPPSGFIPIVITKRGTLSPQGQWEWNGIRWSQI